MSEPKDTGGPAFPCPASIERGDGGYGGGDRRIHAQRGMDLRDYFAAKAMAGLLAAAAVVTESEPIYERLAELSFKCADAMLKARTAERGEP